MRDDVEAQWTMEAILARLGDLPRCPSVAEADLEGHAESIYVAGCRTDSETAKAAAGSLARAHAALAALGPRARYALTRALHELRPDPWHHPVGGYMPVPPSPWDPQYQRPLSVDLLLEALDTAQGAQRAHVAPGRREKLTANLLAEAIVHAWYQITGAWPPADPYKDRDAVHPFDKLACDLFQLAGRRDWSQSQTRVAIRTLKTRQ